TTKTYTLSLHDALPILNRIVPPGVSYTPRLFIPTKRFSTISTRPIPCLPPSSFSLSITCSGVIASPLIATQLPCSNSSSTYSARSEEHTSELQSRENLV